MRTKFARANYFPPGWEADLGRFLGLFNRYGYIYRPLAGGSWASANERWALTDSEIIKAISLAHDRFYLGARAGKTSQFAVLDIDTQSKYHNQKDLGRLQRVLEKAGLGKSSLFRSSISEGWHLYLFFDETIASSELHRELVTLLRLNNFTVAKGMLEVFPNPGKNSQGMGLRLPLQSGFAWLDKQTLEVDYDRSQMSATRALTYFLDLLESDANSFRDFQKLKRYNQELAEKESALLASASPSNVIPLRASSPVIVCSENQFVATIFGHLPNGMNAENWQKGREFYIHGLTGPSQRAEAIFCLNHYLFYGDPSRNLGALGYGYEEERDWAVQEFLASRHNGKSVDISRGRADALEQSTRASHWLPPIKRLEAPSKYSAIRPISWIKNNEKRRNDARQRIQLALAGLKKLARSFTTVELQEASECSRQTLYKHQDIWRRDYEGLADGFFASCTDEYNAVVGAACPKSEPPSTVSQKIVPPGLLAARRIVEEMSLRGRRNMCKTEKKKRDRVELVEKQWRLKVAELIRSSPPKLPLGQVKALLFVLQGYLMVAPCEEDGVALFTYIRELRAEVQRRSGPPAPS